jgi:hypothetical protein
MTAISQFATGLIPIARHRDARPVEPKVYTRDRGR